MFTKNKGNILFNQSQIIKIRKFNIDTVLLSSPEFIFKLSIVLRIYKSSFRTKLYHCERPPYITRVQYLLTGFWGWGGTCSSPSALPGSSSQSRSLGWEVVGTSVTTQYKGQQDGICGHTGCQKKFFFNSKIPEQLQETGSCGSYHSATELTGTDLLPYRAVRKWGGGEAALALAVTLFISGSA